MLPITDINLVDGVLVASDPLAFTINIDVIADTVTITIDDVLIYADETARNRFQVVRTPMVDGYRYEVTAPAGWEYDARIRVDIVATYAGAWWYRWFTDHQPLTGEPYGDEEPMDTDTATLWLTIQEDPSCFIGPVNEFEESLLFPFLLPNLRRTEELRAFLLDQAISRPQAHRAVRWLFLRAYDSALAPVLRDIVVTPTVQERRARLCHQRTNVELDVSLRGKVDLLPQVILELQQLGLPEAHAQLCRSYDRDDPNLRIPLACMLVCLAKALEVNAIV